MCGICGFYNIDGTPQQNERLLEAMRESLVHRGPDGQGGFLDGGYALGHTRLAVIDLVGGSQPLFSEDGNVVLVCNGEIYNYRELRSQLEARGHAFRTASDNEVILHLWEDHGVAALQHLRGMFALALYDRRQECFFGARDRFGQKPLFYHRDGKHFAFASEIKSLLRLPDISPRLDLISLDHFLFYQFVPHARTLFENIVALPPGHYFLFQSAELTVRKYWSLELRPRGDISEADQMDRLDGLMREAVSSRLVSDVPVGLFLSGGIDSSLIAAMAAQEASDPLPTFSIAFKERRYDESEFARQVSEYLKTEHHELLFQPKDLAAIFEEWIGIFDQPIADRASLANLFLAANAAKHLKVVLTGDGGDEVFAGYEKYRAGLEPSAFLASLDARFPSLFSATQLGRAAVDRFGWQRLRARWAHRFLPYKQVAYLKQFWEGRERYRLYRPEVRQAIASEFQALDKCVNEAESVVDPVLAMQAVDIRQYLPYDLLLKNDYCTMAYGLEARSPLLDHKLAEHAARLPLALKVTRQETKVALRRLAGNYLPASLAKRPKRGFGVPLQSWFRHELRDWLKERLLRHSSTVPLYFNPETVQSLLEEHWRGKRNHAPKILSLIVFELWYRRYIERR